MDKKPKKWTSKRLNDKKDELGIVTNPPPIIEEKKEYTKKFPDKEKTEYTKKSFDKEKKVQKFSKPTDNKKNSRNRNNRRNEDRIKHVIKISNLPTDIEVKELYNLITPWGDIGNINIKLYTDVTCSYIDFFNLDEANYFVEALNSTPFGNMILRVELMNFDKKS